MHWWSNYIYVALIFFVYSKKRLLGSPKNLLPVSANISDLYPGCMASAYQMHPPPPLTFQLDHRRNN